MTQADVAVGMPTSCASDGSKPPPDVPIAATPESGAKDERQPVLPRTRPGAAHSGDAVLASASSWSRSLCLRILPLVFCGSSRTMRTSDGFL